ncbi:MAG: TRAP transporter small permease [Proteobacteria bacterium]|nr:MAG: TRAP transporter small permease [Pseudomonadota bacterium]
MTYLVRALKYLDENIEKLILVISLGGLAAIVIVAVVQRFAFSYQVPWSGSIPIYLFLWVTWIGAAHNVRTRTQLRFAEIRTRLPYTGQYLCYVLDAVLWVSISSIVVYYSLEQIELIRQNFAIVQGTENLQQWGFYLATPLGWSLVVFRALQNFWEDTGRFLRREPFEQDSMIFSLD